jgi:serine/threonine-protein kinase
VGDEGPQAPGRAPVAGYDAEALRARLAAAVGDAYAIGDEVGRGGIAVVYAARDRRLRREVALKVLPPDLAFRPDVRTRFLREAETASRLNHPHIVPIYAVEERDGLAFMVMALVRGESLAQRLRRERRLPLAEAARLLAEVADALAYAHASGVIHRDIKPDNILIDGESGRAVVTDFGIARAVEASGERLTKTGIAMGTPAFMSPEQATGEREIDGRSDVYSLGVVGWLLLAGRLPFDAPNTPAMLLAHVSTPAPRLADVRPDAPEALVGAIQRCLAKRPDDRWPTAAALREALVAAQRAMRVAPATPAVSGERGGEDGGAVARPAGRHHADWSPRPVPPPAPPAPAPPAANPATGDGVPLAVRVRRFRYRAMGNLLILAGLFLLNLLTSGFPWVVFPALGMSLGLLGRYARLRERGATWRDVVYGPREGAASAAPTPTGPSLDATWRRVGGELRAAVDDRVAIAELSRSLSDADRALVPDAEPTADALLERASGIAAALDRLDRDVSGDPLGELDRRIAAVEAEPATAPDRERRLQLLARQRESLRDLVTRRSTLQGQLERATLALHALRLDLAKLRALGVGAAIGETGDVTTEARALSRDIGRALEVADELRRL